MTEPDGVRCSRWHAAPPLLPQPDERKSFADEFEYIWAKYPKQIGKDDAFTYYVARRREGVTARTLYDATVLYAKQRDGQDPKFTMRGSTFFGPNGRWKEPFEIQGGNGHSQHGQRPFDLTKVMAEEPAPQTKEDQDADSDPLRDL